MLSSNLQVQKDKYAASLHYR